MKRLLVALGAIALVFATALPAHAGNWAVTELDPLPAELKPDMAYTVGYWVLQHGTHPFAGSAKGLGATGLHLTGENGQTLVFEGTALPEPAHYAVSIRVPAGKWKVQGIQGIFEMYYIGTLAVPGGLTMAPPQYPVAGDSQVTDYWGAVKPPGFPWKAKTTIAMPANPQATVPAVAKVTRAAPVTAPEDGSSPWRQPYILVVVAVAAVAATLLVQRAAGARVRRGPAVEKDPEEAAERAPEPRRPLERPETEDVITIGRDG